MNTKFTYLYRDGANNKRFGSVVFTGMIDDGMKAAFNGALDDGSFFIAHQVRVPEVFLWDPKANYDPETFTGTTPPGHYIIVDSVDHGWHQAHEFGETTDEPTDEHNRTVAQFIEEVIAASVAGWQSFEPRSRQ